MLRLYLYSFIGTFQFLASDLLIILVLCGIFFFVLFKKSAGNARVVWSVLLAISIIFLVLLALALKMKIPAFL